MYTLNNTFEPKTLADDLHEVRRIYAQLFDRLSGVDWNKPVQGGTKEWTLHETIAHLVALNGAGLEGIKHALRGENYTFIGLESRYKLNDYNRKGIDEHMDIPRKELCAKLLDILDEATGIARNLSSDQADLTVEMSIYNRPVTIVEAISIIIFHAGLAHSAQVAEPAGLPPLWMQLSPEFRHRMVARTLRAFSMLYRLDLFGSLHDTLIFRIDGPEGGEWYVELSPDHPTSREGAVEHPGLVIHLRNTAVFCQMLTSRLNIPLALISGRMKLRGDLRLFLRMDTMFSVDARPKVALLAKKPSDRQQALETLSR
jgi:hypothetical protein